MLSPGRNREYKVNAGRRAGNFVFSFPGHAFSSVNAKQLARPVLQSGPSRCESGHGCHDLHRANRRNANSGPAQAAPKVAYVIREKVRRNVNLSQLTALGLRPGPWLKQLKESTSASEHVVIGGSEYSIAELRTTLIAETPGEAVAYLTDFRLDDAAMERLVPALRGCRTIVCEGKFRHADLELARKNYHMTTVLADTLAQRAGVKELILFHLSDRYRQEDWLEMLAEAKQIFPNTRYPSEWHLGQ